MYREMFMILTIYRRWIKQFNILMSVISLVKMTTENYFQFVKE